MSDIRLDTTEGRIKLLFRRLTPLSPVEIAKLTTDKYGTVCAVLRRGLASGLFERRKAESKYVPEKGWSNRHKKSACIWVYYLRGDRRNTFHYKFVPGADESEILPDSVTHGMQLPET